MGDVGAFGSLVCEVWEGSGLEPDRGQGIVEGGQDVTPQQGALVQRVQRVQDKERVSLV